MDETHLLNEAKQIRLFLEKIKKIIASDYDKTKPTPDVNTTIEDIDQISVTTKNFLEKVSKDNTISVELRTKINHELRTPLVPILAYAEMLLDPKFGSLSDEQRKRLEMMRSNIKTLTQTIHDLFNEKNFNAVSNKPEENNSHEIRELRQENNSHEIRELRQEKKIQDVINTSLSEELEQTRKENKEMRDKLKEDDQKIRESVQEKMFISKESRDGKEKNLRLQKKYYITLAIIAVVVSAGFTVYSLYVVELVGQQYKVPNPGSYSSSYVVQNLQGDTVATWVAWNISDSRVLHVHIVNTANLAQDKIDIIKDVILSTKIVSIDDSLNDKGPRGTSSVYYMGWQGAAAKSYSTPTKLYIPQKFDINGSPGVVGDIELILTNDISPDGYSGFTKSLADGNQILKSKITIYGANKIDPSWLAAVLRHEFGHALGLAHSTAHEDLMSAMIQTNYPYISGCDVDALNGLYNGDENSKVVCKK
jgi:hypothetical protein